MSKHKPIKHSKPDVFSLPVYDSMKQAAVHTHIPIAVLKRAKAAGCVAFRWNRVSLEPLLEWLFSPDRTEEDVDWGVELKKEQALTVRARRLELDGKLIEVDSVREQLSAIEGGARSLLEQKLCNELPAMMALKPVHEIRPIALKLFDEVAEKMRGLVK